jgi:hypothetical protein
MAPPPALYGPKRRRARLYTPKTDGKAERFVQTALREWAYARLEHNPKKLQTF